MMLSTLAPAPTRLAIVRQIGFSLYPGRNDELRYEVKTFLKRIEQENTVEGDLAYSFLASSDFRFADGYSREDREEKFRARGMNPYSNAEDYPDFKSP
jgi:hypothetical protein